MLGSPSADSLFAAVGAETKSPVGWIDFCGRHTHECFVRPTRPRDVVLTAAAWQQLVEINRRVNAAIKPLTDLEHWGEVEKWSYPDDGYGDCEDYVLLKRQHLITIGWPREALLITVVRDKRGDGHAVLTVRTSKGEFVLDNQEEKVLLWTETGYRFVKRQSQADPNVWVLLGPSAPQTTTSR
ncbi:MAG TPA: transglutaminase-like cysteine peptidase [Candidatus Paceibacterota bacterium]